MSKQILVVYSAPTEYIRSFFKVDKVIVDSDITKALSLRSFPFVSSCDDFDSVFEFTQDILKGLDGEYVFQTVNPVLVSVFEAILGSGQVNRSICLEDMWIHVGGGLFSPLSASPSFLMKLKTLSISEAIVDSSADAIVDDILRSCIRERVA
jgi:hypothetical protein